MIQIWDEPERCEYCRKDTTHEYKNEQGLCESCAKDPQVIEDLENEIAMFESFQRYYRNYKLKEDGLELANQ